MHGNLDMYVCMLDILYNLGTKSFIVQENPEVSNKSVGSGDI